MSFEKNEEYIVDILDNGYQGEGIAKIENFTLFVPGVIKGEKVRIAITKLNKNYGYARVIEIIEKSLDREQPICDTYKRCGGCHLQHLSYDAQIDMKTKQVKDTIEKQLGELIEVKQTIGMGIPYGYRNKAQYPIGKNKEGIAILGFFAERTHEVIPIDKCYIQNSICDLIAKDICHFINEKKIEVYSEYNKKGVFRHVVIRVGIRTDEVMVTLVVNRDKVSFEAELVDKLVGKYKNIKTIIKNVNKDNTNVIFGKENIVLYGEGYITDILGEFKFKMSNMSFYQVNPIQTEVLYSTAMKYADLSGEEIVFDLYCGIGTISIFASQNAKKVYGIEVVEDAIINAKENAELNNINNIEFMVGKVEEVLPSLYRERSKADVVFVDPPRKGCDEKVLNTLLQLKPKKIVYISCNPATLARDIKILMSEYVVEKIQPVDMFPNTYHVECGVLLTLKND